ncbi:flagellar biosynthesis regulator FlaF [Roseovarius sp. SCSIO 43702]|uniref:flagellar biosynthesis regulator FlaF n=1 Tax=Roseovarius sp. SCSIO 43702 TaxID=2823043 RepID=UPI001C73138D|nr:flagellar biosynthesis regulator FlaF [Roseovarius sp. SCSIO 43702]QYX57104.1 flagellar biosynthesis regulator FlaF [Roseovarius sp. SCSIO 43702]
MNAIRHTPNAYAQNIETVSTPRAREYEAVARTTQLLKRASDKGAAGFGDLAHAIHINRRLWTILAVDVADRGNGLPDDLKARIVYLAEFTREHSRLVMQRKASPEPLIEINRAIMAGLKDGARHSTGARG